MAETGQTLLIVTKGKMDSERISVVIGPLNVKENLGKLEFGRVNPGIAGTEFQLLSLALSLNRKKEFDIEIICSDGIPVGLNPGIKTTRLIDVDKFKPRTVLISPVSTISNIKVEYLRDCKVILSSHHPHDKVKRKIRKQPQVKLVRVVGAYSYLVDPKNVPTVYIPNYYLSKDCPNQDISKKSYKTAGNISSYHPSKGTHHVIGMFNLLCKQINGLKFELVGSSALYANSSESPVARFKSSFAASYNVRIARLVNRLQSSAKGCEIKEYGLQSDNLPKIVLGWSFAVINPLGIGESDPASIKDCLAVGVPVFSTGDFGTWDYQRFFPETTASSPLKLIKTINAYLNEVDLQIEIQSRIKMLTKELTERNIVISEVWEKTIIAISEEGPNPEKHSDVFSPTIISNRMFKRIIIRKFLYRLPRYGTFSNFIRDRYWSFRLNNG